MNILGISALYHDSAAALVSSEKYIVAAAQEERFSRKRHDLSIPSRAIAYCIKAGRLEPHQIDLVVFYEQPHKKFNRLIDGYLSLGKKGAENFESSFSLWVQGKLYQADWLIREMTRLAPQVSWQDRIFFAEHHMSHAACAFYPSPFRESLIITIDAVGERASTSIALGKDNRIEIIKELDFPDSLGMLYAAFTYYTGFKINSGEYKMMGLAPYGEPIYKKLIMDELIELHKDGSFVVDQSYFDYFSNVSIINSQFERLFDGPPRKANQAIEKKHLDLAASIQAVTEEVVLNMTRVLARETGQQNLCLAGGVALNCVANGKIARDGTFDNIWIQPAAGDAGGALGAALHALHSHNGFFEKSGSDDRDAMQGAYLGPEYSDQEIEKVLKGYHAIYRKYEFESLIGKCAEFLAKGNTVAWFQGRMEFGPRALGARSILADPRNPEMQRKLNLQVKKRESFRPFAPAVMSEYAGDWFELDQASPYMLLVSHVRQDKRVSLDDHPVDGDLIDQLNIRRSEIPAVTHVDFSARVQTVHQNTNPKFYALLEQFRKQTACPVLINTSFNVRGEPIVCSPADAFQCFVSTDIDYLAIGSFLLSKKDQDTLLSLKFSRCFDPD